MTPCPCPQRQSWLCPQDWIPPESLIHRPRDCCVEACASRRSRTVWRVPARCMVQQKSRGTCLIQSYLEARGQKQTTVRSETQIWFLFSNSSILLFCNKMSLCYSLVKRASSRESGVCRFLWISEVFCLISLLIQSRNFSSDARVFGNTSQLLCYWIWREAQWAIKTRSKSQRLWSSATIMYIIQFCVSEICHYMLNLILSSYVIIYIYYVCQVRCLTQIYCITTSNDVVTGTKIKLCIFVFISNQISINSGLWNDISHWSGYFNCWWVVCLCVKTYVWYFGNIITEFERENYSVSTFW